MDTIKVRNGIDLTEAEDIKKRWQDINLYVVNLLKSNYKEYFNKY